MAGPELKPVEPGATVLSTIYQLVRTQATISPTTTTEDINTTYHTVVWFPRRYTASTTSKLLRTVTFAPGDAPNKCLQGHGRQCTDTEHSRRYLNVHKHAQLTLADMDTSHFSVIFASRCQIYNPSVAIYNGKIYMITRFEGRNTTGQWLVCPDRSMNTTLRCPVKTLRMISFVALCELNANYKCTTPLQILEYNLNWPEVAMAAANGGHSLRQLGPEDPRVFSWDKEQFIAVNGPPLRWSSDAFNVRCMKIQRIFPNPSPIVDLTFAVSEKRKLGRIEKNWSPIRPAPDGATFLFSTTLEPHDIVSCDAGGQCTSLSRTSQQRFFSEFTRKWGLGALHLGTNAIELPNGRCAAIFHGITATRPLEYYNFVYTFESAPPYAILAVASEPLLLPLGDVGTGFTFSSSLSWVDGRVVVGYTVKDRTASIATFTPSEFLVTLEKIPTE